MSIGDVILWVFGTLMLSFVLWRAWRFVQAIRTQQQDQTVQLKRQTEDAQTRHLEDILRLERRIDEFERLGPNAEEAAPQGPTQVYLNGLLLREGSLADDGDYYPGTEESEGELHFNFRIHPRDTIELLCHNGDRESRDGSEVDSSDPHSPVLRLNGPHRLPAAKKVPELQEPSPSPAPPRSRWERLTDDDDFDIPP